MCKIQQNTGQGMAGKGKIMLIDTEKLKKAITNYYEKASEAINNLKSDRRAIEILTSLEEKELKELSYITEIERLAKHKYGDKTYTTPKKPKQGKSLTEVITHIQNEEYYKENK
jgi:hypothetical protein